jgi:hypothetical protein
MGLYQSKKFCIAKETVKRLPTGWEKILADIHLTRD